MNNIQASYDAWLAQPGLPEDLAAELRAVADDPEAVSDRFYRDLAFGPGGLRGRRRRFCEIIPCFAGEKPV